mmetsp:Transcript_74098/g.90963  ORF Transcript_74098/g.90963 Transcript_74098/m.90963 type:complete len:239 (+) Transcript_74098:44-760(+)
MPLDHELSQRLEKRRDRTHADSVSPEMLAVDRAYEAHIDQELKNKLRQQSELILRDNAGTIATELKRLEKTATQSARIDQELAKKLQKRQSDLRELEATGGQAKAEDFRTGASFEAHIDGELAAKLRKRLDIESRPVPEPAEPRRKEAEGTPESDLNGELAQKLRKRRQVVNSQGDVFQKDQDVQDVHAANEVQPAEAPHSETVRSTVESKRKRRFWWLFCCSLVVAAYGAYQSIHLE